MYDSNQRRDAARVMERLARKVEAAKTEAGWVSAGMQFLRKGIELNCLDHLNELGEVAGGRSALSERTLDGLFEWGDWTDQLVVHIHRQASFDDGFREGIVTHVGEAVLSPERLSRCDGRDLFSTVRGC